MEGGSQVRSEMYRLVTWWLLACSVLAFLTLSVTLPILYNLVQQTNAYVEREMAFCQVCSLPSSIPLSIND